MSDFIDKEELHGRKNESMGGWSHLCFFVNQLWNNNVGNHSLFSSRFSDSFRAKLALENFRHYIDADWDILFHYFRKNRYESI